MPKPKTFPGRKKGEKIFLFLHRHPLSFLRFFGIAVAMIIIPLFVVFLLYVAGLNIDTTSSFLGSFEPFAEDPPERTLELFIVFISSYFLFVWAVFLVGWIDYYLDVSIITNRRLIDINQDRLFARSISECDLVDVEDAKAKVHGVLSTFFHFGDVFVQTAGAQENFELSHVPNPYQIARKIVDLHEQAVAEEEKREAREIGKTIAEKNQKNVNSVKKEIPKTRRMVRLGEKEEARRKRMKESAEEAIEDMKKDVSDFENKARSDMGGG